MNRVLFGFALAVWAALAQTPQPAPAAPPPPIISPDVHPDHTVTFRFRAPNAKEVFLAREGTTTRTPMQKDDSGIWTVTTEALEPDIYELGLHSR